MAEFFMYATMAKKETQFLAQSKKFEFTTKRRALSYGLTTNPFVGPIIKDTFENEKLRLFNKPPDYFRQ